MSLQTTEVDALIAVQSAIATPEVIKGARAMSHFGEHALGWMAIGAIGAVVDRKRRRAWANVAAAAFISHGGSIVVKRIVRRKRPTDPRIQVNVSTPSKLSFPSSHATSTAAAALLIGRASGLPVLPIVLPPMMVSRLVLGVHYPTDVVVGATLGLATAVAVDRFGPRISTWGLEGAK